MLWPTAAVAQKFLGGVVDYAGILSPADVSRLQGAAGKLAPRIETDLFVVTVDDRDPRWVAMGAHRAMVERAFKDLEAARARHYGANQKLTVLVAFKSSVVLHLYTNRQAIEQTLLLNNFYGGLRTTELKIRRPNESHADAATRYLGAFNASATSGLPSQLSDTILGYIDKFALLMSRELWEKFEAIPEFGPVYIRGLLQASSALASAPMLPAYVGFLLACMLFYLMIKIGAQWLAALVRQVIRYAGSMIDALVMLIRLSVPRWLASTGRGIAAAVGTAVEEGVELLLLAPILALLFSVANYDVENMLYLHQVFGADLLQHLEWARDIWSVSPDLGWPLIGGAVLVVAGLEWIKCSQRAKTFPAWTKPAYFAARLLKVVALTISTGIFTSLVAVCFIVTIVAFQVWDILKPDDSTAGMEAQLAGDAGVKQA